MKIILLTILLRTVLTIRVPTSWTDQQPQSTNFQTTQQSKPYGSVEQRHQNPNYPQFVDNKNGWVPIFPSYPSATNTVQQQSPPHYYFLNPPPPLQFVKTPLSQQQWVKFGLNNQDDFLKPDNQENPNKPAGYEVFKKHSNLFDKKRSKFRENLDNFPKKHKFGRQLENPDNQDAVNRNYNNGDRNEDSAENYEFTPTRIYSQVRHYEDEQHLPKEQADDPRLREVIRDSKIHTVYSEEGYEDSGYDHGGHEKHAEEDEGYGEFDEEIEQDDHNSKDTDNKSASSQNHQIRDQDDGDDEELQISSEIKFVKSPKNNNTETHKYIKIAPKSTSVDAIASESHIRSSRYKRIKRTINEKYPYYNRYEINPDSPLRYSENPANIPDKQNDDFAFYRQSDEIDCAEIETDIDPIPERIRNTDEGVRNDQEMKDAETSPQTPRLLKLGDKIDCFKMKYFGEMPLDNPLFHETTIPPVKSIFNNERLIQEEAVVSTINDENLGTKILNDIVEHLPQLERDGKSADDAANDEHLPEGQALLRKRRRRIRPKRPYFDYNNNNNNNNRFVPTQRPYPLLTTVSTISEVYYKNDIKPDEQLNVLNDIINNIKNAPKEPLVQPSNKFYIKAPPTTTKKPNYPDLIDDDNTQYDHIELLKVGVTKATKLPKTTTTTEKLEIDEQLEDEEVVGLSPPTPKRYQTIYEKVDKQPVTVNQFFVDGMKPPPPHQQKYYLYPDYKTNLIKRRRFRRDTSRPVYYSQVVRNRNKPIDIDDDDDDAVVVTDDNDDDYVPHRPKNYHYDEKLGRIVYDKVTQPPENREEEEEEVEEIVITEPPLPKPTRKNNRLKFVKNPDEPSFLEFINKLKSNNVYKQITDPPITEKPIITTTTTIKTSSVAPLSTTPGEFLNVLSKIRSNPKYHRIDDKDATVKTATTTTTTAIPEDIAEEVEDDDDDDEGGQVENIQNSPGGLKTGQNFQIFDITDYLPKIRNYRLRTSVDTTKYKTIERPSLRHSSTNAEETDKLEESEQKLSEIQTTATTTRPTTTTTRPTTTTPTTLRRLRNRTKIPTTTTTGRIEATTVRHDKARRVYPRRRVARIKITPKTEESEENSTKIVQRRHQPETTTPPPQPTTTTTTPENVTIFKDYDKTERHGGNYRQQDEIKENPDTERLTDVVPKPDMFYTDPALPNNINDLMEKISTTEPTVDVNDNEYDDDISREEDETEEERVDGDDEENTKTAASNKAGFIKDPGQRLYYYAPI